MMSSASLNNHHPVSLSLTTVSSRIQLASAMLFLVNAVALGIILYLHPQSIGNLSLMMPLGSVGGISLLIFVISSVTRFRAKKAPIEEEAKESKLEKPAVKVEAVSASPTRSVLEERPPLSEDQEIHREEAPPPPGNQDVRGEGPPLHEEEPPGVQPGIPSSFPPAQEIHEEPLPLPEDREVHEEAPPSGDQRVGEGIAHVQAQVDVVDLLKKDILPPLFTAFESLIKSAVKADGKLAKRKDSEEKVNLATEAFKHANELVGLLLSSPQMYVKELIRFFGKSKTTCSVYLRRLVSAYNSGNKEKYKEAEAEYKAVLSGHDFSDMKKDLQSGVITLNNLHTYLQNHFSSPDEVMRNLGVTVLQHIFDNTKQNPLVQKAFEQVKKSKDSHLVANVEKLIQTAFEEAKISKEQMETWNKELVSHMLNTQFKKTMKQLLGMMARNIRILKLLFNEELSNEQLFITLDQTFLASESSDCMLREALQKEILTLQSTLNQKRAEKQRIAFVILPEEDSRDYQQLCDEESVVNCCFHASKDYKLDELRSINGSSEVKSLNQKHHIRLVALPASVSDHPFKLFKNHEGKIRLAIRLFKPFIAGIIKPKLLQILPQFEKGEAKKFDFFLEALLNLMINPIYDGAIAYTDFRKPFQNIISTVGEELAISLEGLVADEALTFEKIRDVWVTSVDKFAKAFGDLTRGS